MVCVIQRIKHASLTADGAESGCCQGPSLLVFVGVMSGDGEAECEKCADKISKMRIFEDENGKMNLSVFDKEGQILAVSNFTLCASCRRGNRPDFTSAEKPDMANELYDFFVQCLRKKGIHTETGVFGADMQISCQLDGPVTIVLDTDDLK